MVIIYLKAGSLPEVARPSRQLHLQVIRHRQYAGGGEGDGGFNCDEDGSDRGFLS